MPWRASLAEPQRTPLPAPARECRDPVRLRVACGGPCGRSGAGTGEPFVRGTVRTHTPVRSALAVSGRAPTSMRLDDAARRGVDRDQALRASDRDPDQPPSVVMAASRARRRRGPPGRLAPVAGSTRVSVGARMARDPQARRPRRRLRPGRRPTFSIVSTTARGGAPAVVGLRAAPGVLGRRGESPPASSTAGRDARAEQDRGGGERPATAAVGRARRQQRRLAHRGGGLLLGHQTGSGSSAPSGAAAPRATIRSGWPAAGRPRRRWPRGPRSPADGKRWSADLRIARATTVSSAIGSPGRTRDGCGGGSEQLRPQLRVVAVALERHVAGEREVQDAAERVDVGAGVDPPAADLLRRDVVERADPPARCCVAPLFDSACLTSPKSVT